MTDEIWKAVPRHEGRYEVSDQGRVRSLDRVQEFAYTKGLATRRLQGRLLVESKFSNSYRGVYLGRGSKCYLVHRLVAAVFIENPSEFPEVNHKNLQRADNAVGNLEWVTRSRNKFHSYESGNRKQHGKTTPVALSKVGSRLVFESELAAAIHLGVSAGSAHSARTRDHNCRGYVVQAI